MARRRSRDPKKEQFWRRMVQRQRGSGLSVRGWCRQHGLRESLFYWWRRQLARRGTTAVPTLVPVRVTAGGVTGSHIEIVWPDRTGVRVLGPVDRQALADVLAVLTSTSAAAAEGSAC